MFVRNNRNVSTKISRNSALSKEQVTNVVKKIAIFFNRLKIKTIFAILYITIINRVIFLYLFT